MFLIEDMILRLAREILREEERHERIFRVVCVIRYIFLAHACELVCMYCSCITEAIMWANQTT